MTFTYPDARTWAREHSLANAPRLARLEGFAFQEHPQIVAAFGEDGAAMSERARRRPRGAAARGGTLLFALVVVAGAIAPALGVAIYGDLPPHLAPTAEPVEASVAVPVSSISFMVAAAMQLVLWGMWLRAGARRSPLLLGFAAYSAIMAGFAAMGLPARSAVDGFADVGRWMWPVWLTLALSVPLVVAVLLRWRIRALPQDEPEPASRPPMVSEREHARTLVRTLPAETLSGIRSDRDDALRILAERGLISADRLDEALAADLGTLFTLDHLRRSEA